MNCNGDRDDSSEKPFCTRSCEDITMGVRKLEMPVSSGGLGLIAVDFSPICMDVLREMMTVVCVFEHREMRIVGLKKRRCEDKLG